MSTDQLHGKAFEDRIKAALFRGSSDGGRSATSKFDVEAHFDKAYQLPTSIKSAKHIGNVTIGLSDASRFWLNVDPFRMIVGLYQQCDFRKEFFEVHEFFIHGDMYSKLKGEITYCEVNNLHKDMGIKNYPKGCHLQARDFAHQEVLNIKSKGGAIILNPKIDSKTQRRLQCSIKLQELIDITESGIPYRSSETGIIANSNHKVFTDNIGTDYLPFYISGTSRKFN